jgi:hypothetical protein
MLPQCRHILKYTYMYGFFISSDAENPHKQVFEVQQAYAQVGPAKVVFSVVLHNTSLTLN